MRCVLGLDGGGTKTDCVLLDENGDILSRARSGPSNPLRIPIASAVAALQEAARQALASASVPRDSLAALCAGLAGAARPDVYAQLGSALGSAFPGLAIQLLTDLDISLAAAGPGPAIALIAGTGAAAIGRDASGRTARAGGYGHIIGDPGSAYDVGRLAVLCALRHHDRTGSDSPLGREILIALSASSWPEAHRRVTENPDEVFTRIFPIVAAAGDNADESARVILADAARHLAQLASILAERLHLAREPFFIAKSGGTVGRSKFLDQALDDLLIAAAPSARIGLLPISPAHAAARLALESLQALRTQRS